MFIGHDNTVWEFSADYAFVMLIQKFSVPDIKISQHGITPIFDVN